jgi:hypothetical protein
MVGTKILLFGGQDIIQNVTAIDMYLYMDSASTLRLTLFGSRNSPSQCRLR